MPLSYLVYFLIGGGIIRSELVQGTFAFRYIEAIVASSLAMTNKLFAFHPVVERWNFMLLGLMVVTLLVRQLVMLPVDRAEQWAKSKFAPSKKKAIRSTGHGGSLFGRGARGHAPAQQDCANMLRSKQYLYQEKAHLAFLSIDVVGSTKMKLGEDKLAIEHAFAEYKKFVERILKQNNIWKVAWTPDGIMCAFITVTDAVKAASGGARGAAMVQQRRASSQDAVQRPLRHQCRRSDLPAGKGDGRDQRRSD